MGIHIHFSGVSFFLVTLFSNMLLKAWCGTYRHMCFIIVASKLQPIQFTEVCHHHHKEH